MRGCIVTLLACCCLLAAPVVQAAGTVQLPVTGQSKCFDTTGAEITCAGTGQDGDKKTGVAWDAATRFTDNSDGTVTDNLTGLVWLKNADCFSVKTWATALTSANTLASGACGLSDGSQAGQWRLPNRKELQSLVDRSRHSPALPSGHPFSAVKSYFYWSSSTSALFTASALVVNMEIGYVDGYSKDLNYYVWPVRAGQ